MRRIALVIGVLGFLLSALVRAEPFVVSDIRIEGLQRIAAGSLFASLPVNIGDQVDAAQLRDAAKALFASGNFEDVQIARDESVLVIVVRERPSISEITIEGNKAIETEALLDGLKGAGLSEGQVLKRSTLEGMRLELQRQYVSQGRYDASIETEVVEQPRNRVGVNITIDEGNVAKIANINIVGTQDFDKDDLLDLMELTSSGWFTWMTGTDKYAKEKLKGDLEKIESWYLDSGYAEFNLDSTQVSISPDRKSVYITINLTEGQVYTIDKVELSGDLVVDEEEINRYVLVKEGQTFSQLYITKSEEFVAQRLGNDGYSFAEVKGTTTVNAEDRTVAVKFFVNPGKRSYVNRISFNGNTRTRDDVLRREMRQMEGASASNLKIDQGKVRLDRLGFFKEVRVETTPVPGTDDQLNVDYSVEEQPSGSIGASVGFAQDSGLILGANLQQNNFLGSGKQVGVAINTSRYQDSASFSYTNPYYTKDGVSRGFSVYYRETDFEEINVASFRTDSWGANINFGYPLSEIQRLRFSLGYQNTHVIAGDQAVQEIKGSPRLFDSPSVAYEYISGSEFDDEGNKLFDTVAPIMPNQLAATPEGFLDIHGEKFGNFVVDAAWIQSTLNRGQLATRGYSQSLGIELAVPGSDLEYFKISYNAQYFMPLTNSLTLRFRGELGYGDGYGNGEELPFFENYRSGGFGSVRGFKSNTLGPRSTPADQYILANRQTGLDDDGNPVFDDLFYYTVDPDTGNLAYRSINTRDDDPFGGNILFETGVELLFPLPFIKDQRTMRSAFFIDAGNVFSSYCRATQANCFDFDLGELRYSVGVGVTWITGFGPLSFSLAKPLNEGDFDDTEIFQFSLGQFF